MDLPALRHRIYRHFADHARAPTEATLAEAMETSVDAVRNGLRALHAAHAITLDADGQLWMAHPFSAVETPFRVVWKGRTWHANCAWDTFGIVALLEADGAVIQSVCADCREPVAVTIEDGALSGDDGLLVHIGVPARDWWRDIGFT